MNAKSQMVGQAKGTTGLIRPKFAPGQLLRDDDLQLGVDYTRELSRLLFKSFFGCGVICGLEVNEPSYECGKFCVTVDGGVALACDGDPVRVPSPTKVTADFDCLKVEPPEELWVLLKGYEKCCAPRAAMCATDDDAQNVCTREVDGFEIRLVTELPPCVCGCPPVVSAGTGTTIGTTDNAPAPNHEGADASDCQCADPNRNCYKGHYGGECGCPCCDPTGECSGVCGGDCGCEWILLAHLKLDTQTDEWSADNTVRRFIRPVLIRDPELAAKTKIVTRSLRKPPAGAAAKHATKKTAKKKPATAKPYGAGASRP